LVHEERYEEMIDTIRNYWGKQTDAGATTFWEMYHDGAPRLTRSHCHGWSAAPTYFLSQQVLGVQPLEPGYAKVRIAPQIGTLKWVRGRVPTPRRTSMPSAVKERLELSVDIPFARYADRAACEGNVEIVEGNANRAEPSHFARPTGETVGDLAYLILRISLPARRNAHGVFVRVVRATFGRRRPARSPACLGRDFGD
jgi:hypothetical protein